MAAKNNIFNTIARLAKAEERFLAARFLAPVIAGGKTQVRIDGVRCQMAAEPGDFSGWGVFRPISHARAKLERTAKLPDHRRLMGFTMDGDAPVEGSPIWSKGDIVGHVTGSWTSPVLGRSVMLGWQKVSPFVDTVEIDGRTAIVTATPFYDPEGHRARA